MTNTKVSICVKDPLWTCNLVYKLTTGLYTMIMCMEVQCVQDLCKSRKML